VETANGDVVAVMFLTGSFLADRLLFGGADAVNNHFSRWTGKALAAQGMYAEPSQSYPSSAWN
jgi:hypothetical protein